MCVYLCNTLYLYVCRPKFNGSKYSLQSPFLVIFLSLSLFSSCALHTLFFHAYSFAGVHVSCCKNFRQKHACFYTRLSNGRMTSTQSHIQYAAHMVLSISVGFENEKRHICVVIIKIMNHFRCDFFPPLLGE